MFMKHFNYTNFVATATVAALAGTAFAATPIRLEAEDAPSSPMTTKSS